MGHWDEHLAVQYFINEVVNNSNNEWINNDFVAFILGIGQHEMYDLVVNEKPINLTRIDFERMDVLKEEMPSIYLNLIGIGISMWKTFKKYFQNPNNASACDKLKKDLLGLLGAITPDILEGLRLLTLSDGREVWKKGMANQFHLVRQNGQYLINTFDNSQKDIIRRILLQNLVVSVELFRIEW